MALNAIPKPSTQSSPDSIVQCSKDARRDGTFAGITSGLVGALIGTRFMRFNRNMTILCGVLTGVSSGYFFYQAFLESNLARLRAQELSSLRASKDSFDPPNQG
ncbi:hypothetical protein JAAARDRAFT_62520 [Jaapia argillacea MUCL 33604]|uniref:Uncharacterized protein n=1 Tax=Jaapia argillacea MUCL 33604 TaxID=933084 RepID=A0A067P942_9AGAM|nr:hypothetical protein JAAARDRAFT_62520 [Jaapia argillacea MUCL 33604]